MLSEEKIVIMQILDSPAPYTFTFTGLPNNGNLAYQNLKWTNVDHGFNLVGNPYPSNWILMRFMMQIVH
jgi:hypothetical protein